jgi:hypothetical protein
MEDERALSRARPVRGRRRRKAMRLRESFSKGRLAVNAKRIALMSAAVAVGLIALGVVPLAAQEDPAAHRGRGPDTKECVHRRCGSAHQDQAGRSADHSDTREGPVPDVGRQVHRAARSAVPLAHPPRSRGRQHGRGQPHLHRGGLQHAGVHRWGGLRRSGTRPCPLGAQPGDNTDGTGRDLLRGTGEWAACDPRRYPGMR